MLLDACLIGVGNAATGSTTEVVFDVYAGVSLSHFRSLRDPTGSDEDCYAEKSSAQ